MATPFDPEAYAKKRLQEDLALNQPFDPEAHARKRLSESQPPQAQAEQPSQEPEDPTAGLQPAGEYRGYSMLGSPSKEGTYATPNVRKEAIDRLIERGDGSEPSVDARPEGPRPDRSVRENMEAMYSPENLKKSQKALSSDFGDALYSFANIGGLMPRIRGKIAALEDKSEGDFDSKVAKNRAIEAEVARLRQDRSPLASTLGGLARDIALYKTGSGVLSKAPLVGAGGAGKTAEALKLLARGGILGAGVGQASGHNIEDVPTDAAFGTGGEALGAALPYAVGKSVSAVQKLVNFLKTSTENKSLPQAINGMVNKIPFYGSTRSWAQKNAEKAAEEVFAANKQGINNQLSNLDIDRAFAERTAKEAFDTNKQSVLSQIDDLKTQQGITSAQNTEKLNELRDLNAQVSSDALNAYNYNKTAARNKLRDLSENEPAALGEKFLNKIKKSRQNLSDEYGKINNELMSTYGKSPAPVDDLRREITDTLRDNGLLTPKGNVNLAKLNLIQAPERKRMVQVLINIRKALRLNPTIKGLNSLKQDLQSLANYGAPVRTSEEGLFGKLAEKAKGAVDDALSQAAGSGASEFQAVRKKYAQQKPTLDALAKTATRLPERLVVNARVQFPKSKVQEILKTNPEFKDEIGNFVFEHITQTPASQNTIRKTMDYYGRDFLKDLIGEERFNLLNQAEERLTQAAAKFKPKNFENEEAQRRIGELLGDEMGPYSFESAKKTIARKQADAAAQFTAEKKQLQKQLLKKFEFEDPTVLTREALQKQLLNKFEYTDPSVKRIQEKLMSILGKSNELKPNKRLEKVLGSFKAMFPAASNAARLNSSQ